MSRTPRAILSHNSNIVTARWSSSSYRSGTVSNIVKVTYNYPVTTSYWTASDSYTLSDNSATITSVDYVTGTRPDELNYSGRTVTVNWTSNTEPSGNIAGVTVSVYYNAPYSFKYVNVRFTGFYANGAAASNVLANYINFNGKRYP